MARPGPTTTQGAVSIMERVSAIMRPHSGVGGWAPSPKKLSVAPTYAERIGTSNENSPTARLASAEVDTVMRIRDGESILLSGMLQRKGSAKTELVILLTATVVTPGPATATGTR